MANIDHAALRPEIALAWQRAEISGLDPGMDVRESVLADVDRRSRLAVAATPVLDRMAQELSDTRFSVLLADSSSRILDRRYAHSSLATALDRVMAVPGSLYIEEMTGTNALATAYELRRGISVTGKEHFLEALQQFSCYGAPIIHPITHRLEGVLDVTGYADDATALLPPFLLRAVRDIEQHLLDGSRLAEQRLLAAYQHHAVHKPHPVVVLSDDIFLANRAAVDLMHSLDHALLRELAIEAPREGRQQRRVELASGQIAATHYERVVGSPGGVLFELQIEQHARPVIPRRNLSSAAHAVESVSLSQAPVWISGEPGTGRTFTAMRLAGDTAAYLAAGADPALEETAWLAEAARVLQGNSMAVIDDVDLLSSQAAARLARLMDSTTCEIVLTGPAVSELEGTHAALASRCLERITVAPLRSRAEEFPHLVSELLRSLTGGTERTVTPTVLQILKAHGWPGNVRELRAVLSHAVDQNRSGQITVRDLPAAYQTSVRRRHLSVLEQAEHDAILAVLRATGGNKAQAAARLGIGRNTLYERIRRLGISL